MSVEEEVQEANPGQVEPEEEVKKSWDKDRQEIEQDAANARKAMAERDSLRGELTDTQSKIAGLESQIRAKTAAESVEIEDLDPDLVDPKVVSSIKKLQNELRKAKSELSSLSDVAKRYESDVSQRKEDKRKEGRREAILKPLDEKYGSKYRNAALAEAAKIIDKEGKAPEGEAETVFLLQRCYEKLAEKGRSKTITPTDSGSGSLNVFSDDIKSGSTEEVWAQMKKKLGKVDLPSPG